MYHRLVDMFSLMMMMTMIVVSGGSRPVYKWGPEKFSTLLVFLPTRWGPPLDPPLIPPLGPPLMVIMVMTKINYVNDDGVDDDGEEYDMMISSLTCMNLCGGKQTQQLLRESMLFSDWSIQIATSVGICQE